MAVEEQSRQRIRLIVRETDENDGRNAETARVQAARGMLPAPFPAQRMFVEALGKRALWPKIAGGRGAGKRDEWISPIRFCVEAPARGRATVWGCRGPSSDTADDDVGLRIAPVTRMHDGPGALAAASALFTANRSAASNECRDTRLIVAIGSEMPEWGSWAWAGEDIRTELTQNYRATAFRGENVPECHAAVFVKDAPSPSLVDQLSSRSAVLFSPIDLYGSAGEIDGDAVMLRKCARILIHCERLRRYFEPYARVEYIDHHVRFAPPLRRRYVADGPILWVGVRPNLPPVVDWVNKHPLPSELLVLSNWENPERIPDPESLGFGNPTSVRLRNWSPAVHLELAGRARAAIDIKGDDFRARHKPPAKAIDFIASGVPLAMNPDSSPTEHLARMGFEISSPLDVEKWLSKEYWEETRRFGAAIRELLSRRRVGLRYKRIIDEVLAERRGRSG
jgi:hypothetical protein